MRSIALIMLTACSFTVAGVPDSYRARPGGPPPTCDTSFAGRALADVAGATAFALAGMLAYSFSWSRCGGGEDCERTGLAAVPYLIPAGLHITAIIAGEVKADECRRVRREAGMR